MRKLFFLACLCAASAVLACAPQAPITGAAEGKDPVAAGRAIAEVQCAACHAIGPTGESPVTQAPPFRTLSTRYPLNNLEEAFAEGIIVGHPMMPEFTFTPDQISALLAYLNSIQEQRSGAAPARLARPAQAG